MVIHLTKRGKTMALVSVNNKFDIKTPDFVEWLNGSIELYTRYSNVQVMTVAEMRRFAFCILKNKGELAEVLLHYAPDKVAPFQKYLEPSIMLSMSPEEVEGYSNYVIGSIKEGYFQYWNDGEDEDDDDN